LDERVKIIFQVGLSPTFLISHWLHDRRADRVTGGDAFVRRCLVKTAHPLLTGRAVEMPVF
jgi:hypothetical protein